MKNYQINEPSPLKPRKRDIKIKNMVVELKKE